MASGTPAACTTPPTVPMAATAAAAAPSREAVSRTSTAMPTVATPWSAATAAAATQGPVLEEVPHRDRAAHRGDRVGGGEADPGGAAGDDDTGLGLQVELGHGSASPSGGHGRQPGLIMPGVGTIRTAREDRSSHPLRTEHLMVASTS